MAAPIRLILEDIHFPLMEYYDWLATGLWMLQEQGQLEVEIRTTRTTAPFQLHNKAYPALRKAFPKLTAALARGISGIILGHLEAGGKKVTFAYDVGDSPYAFQTDLLLERDLYFKAQCPQSFDPRGFPMARGAFVPYHPDVLAYQDRIVPTMLGRPLSRTLSRRGNAQVLHKWLDLLQTTKDVNLFAFFGTDRGTGMGGPEQVVLDRFAGLVEHPNPKRGLLVEGLRQRYPSGVDARILDTTHPSRRGAKMGDSEFPFAVGHTWHNINVSGFRRSLPFRFVDSFLVGAAVPTDEMAVRWYAPFEPGTDVIDLGPMGYELDQNVDWPRIWQVFDGLMAESQATREDRRRRIAERFQRLWHPQALARHVVDSCLRVLG